MNKFNINESVALWSLPLRRKIYFLYKEQICPAIVSFLEELDLKRKEIIEMRHKIAEQELVCKEKIESKTFNEQKLIEVLEELETLEWNLGQKLEEIEKEERYFLDLQKKISGVL